MPSGEPSPFVVHERDALQEQWDGIVRWRTLLSAERTPSAGMTVGVAEIEPGSSEMGSRHRHADHETYYFIVGRGQVHLDGVDHDVEPGSVVFIPGQTWHFVRNTGHETLRFLYAFPVDQFADVRYTFDNDPGSGPGSVRGSQVVMPAQPTRAAGGAGGQQSRLELTMLEMKQACERCAGTVAADGDALICSFECTYCLTCGSELDHRCMNCGGELVRRPRRSE